jgi:eukaryotic-like serine/threonine-protein kinase
MSPEAGSLLGSVGGSKNSVTKQPPGLEKTMLSRISPCNPDVLRLLLNDRLPPASIGDVEIHLESCQECRRALELMAGGDTWSSAMRKYLRGTDEPEPCSGPDDEPLNFLTPSKDPGSLGKIGPYEVKGILGRGGNGVVLKAFDAGLNRFVAVKVIASVLAGSGAARKRFAREAQAVAAVVHEHVVAVYAVDENGGLPYLVMEYIAGRALQERLDKDGPLALREVLRIGMQTAQGLAAAHAQGLVHRDIKPANILLENGVERVKITDFGLARAVADASLTQSGLITGTPHYMSPEQARGDAVDHRADLFSLGSTLYATCTGHPPFRAETPLAVLRRVTDDTPRPIGETNADMPAWFDAILGRLMAKDPAARIQTAAEVAELLQKCLAHVQQPQKEELPSVPALKLSKRWWWSRRVVIGAALASAVIGLALLFAVNKGVPDPILENAGRSADVIDQELADVRIRAAKLDAETHGSSGYGSSSADEIQREIAQIAERARALEKELTPPTYQK